MSKGCCYLKKKKRRKKWQKENFTTNTVLKTIIITQYLWIRNQVLCKAAMKMWRGLWTHLRMRLGKALLQALVIVDRTHSCIAGGLRACAHTGCPQRPLQADCRKPSSSLKGHWQFWGCPNMVTCFLKARNSREKERPVRGRPVLPSSEHNYIIPYISSPLYIYSID